MSKTENKLFADSHRNSVFESRLEHYNLKIFKLVLNAAMAVLAAIVIKSFIFGYSLNIADPLNLLLVAAARFALSKKPSLRKPLTWLVLFSLVLNSMDAMPEKGNELTSSYVFFPLLVIYAALIGDLILALAATLALLGILGYTYLFLGPFSPRDISILINLVIFIVSAGLCSLLTWYFHRLMQKELFNQLTINQRLTSALFHDIANPLTVIMSLAYKAKASGNASVEEMDRVGRMAERIAGIRDAIRGLDRESGLIINPITVTFGEMADTLLDIFGPSMQDKELSLSVEGDGSLSMKADRDILENSVLANVFSNAVKNSPQGGRIVFSAKKTPKGIELEVENSGEGFPQEIIDWFSGQNDQPLKNSPRGHGYGLWIARSYLSRMGGSLLIENRPGGAFASIILPPA